MKATFIACDTVWDGLMGLYKPWCNSDLHGCCGSSPKLSTWVGIIFVEGAATLGNIISDKRTEFELPIDVDDEELSWADADQDIDPSTFGKIVAWIATNGLMKPGPSITKPPEMAHHIMVQTSVGPDASPLQHMRIRWE